MKSQLPKKLSSVLAGDKTSIPEGKRQLIWDIIVNNNYVDCLEAGFAHGVSSVLIASATSGNLETYDMPSARSRVPNIADLCTQFDIKNVNWHTDTDYKIEWVGLIKQSRQFDFIFIDTDHFFGDTLAGIYLADKLLKTGGTLVLDDVDWCPAKSASMKDRRNSFPKITDKEWSFTGVGEAYNIYFNSNNSYQCEVKNGMAICRKLV